MRVLDLGLKGAEKFCGLMDMPQFFYHSTYNMILQQIYNCIKIFVKILFKNAMKEEIAQTCKARNVDKTTDLTVFGDGKWKKRGFTSLFGASSIIGYHICKVFDIFVKSSYCKMCGFWSKKEGTIEYKEWLETHQEEYSANHKGSSGKMEMDAIIEIFQRSEKNYGVKYINYIGDRLKHTRVL